MQIIQLQKPKRRSLEHLREWMARTDEGDTRLTSSDQYVWKGTLDSDLATLDSRTNDPFTDWVSNFVAPFHETVGHFFKKPRADVEDHNKNTVDYSDEAILRMTTIVAIVLSCLLPVAAIAILHVVESTARRLGFMGGFTALFSLCLAYFTKARAVDIFAATAA
jgi:hypothetical protein